GGGFDTQTVAAGVAPSDIAFADLDGDGRLDVLVSNRSSGDVFVLQRDKGDTFSRTGRYRAGTGLYGLQESGGLVQPLSGEAPVSLVAGRLAGDLRPVAVAVNRGSHSAVALVGTLGGGLSNAFQVLPLASHQPPGSGPGAGPTAEDRPGQAVADDFNG